MPPIAARVGRAPVAASVAQTVRARALRDAGHDVLFLTIGEPDFATPAHAIEAAHAAALHGDTKYPPQDGTRALKDAVARMFARDYRLDFATDQIVVGNGGKQVIFDAFMATLEAGCEIIIPAPYWSAYALMARACDGTPVFVNCPQNNGFRPRVEDIEAAITPAARWLLLNFPNNPSGATLDAEALRELAGMLLRHPHVWILVDDMYGRLVYDGSGPLTLASVEPRLQDRILTVYGVSKTYAMTGWRIGFGAGPAPLIRAMANMQGQISAGVSTVGQAAAVAALDGPQDGIISQIEEYRRRRDLVVDALDAIPGFTCHRPEGAFYVFPSIAGCLGRTSASGRRIESDADFAAALLEEAHVAVVHGAAFGMSPYLRISYATDEATLTRACARIAEFVSRLR
jgi:aspartate aminotransferase